MLMLGGRTVCNERTDPGSGERRWMSSPFPMTAIVTQERTTKEEEVKSIQQLQELPLFDQEHPRAVEMMSGQTTSAIVRTTS